LETEERIVQLRQQGFTYRMIMERLGVTYHQVQKTLTENGLTGPHYKYQRDDVIRKAELEEIFRKAGEITYVGLPGLAWQCLIAILWLYGKRISEVVSLQTDSVFIDDNNTLAIRFHVLKKKRNKNTGFARSYVKWVTLENPYTGYVVDWWEEVRDRERFLFPRPQTKMGHIYRQYAHTVCKEISPRISPHLFRHSLATWMAERGATAYELVNWFDWDRVETALEYVKRSGRMTEKLSERKW